MLFSKTLIGQFFSTIILLLLFITIGLFFDSKFFVRYSDYGQWIANVIMLIVLVFLYFKGTNRVRNQIFYAIIIAVIGEYLFCKVLGMYTYRLNNVPHYVPLGHAILFLGVYYFTRKSKVRLYRKNIEYVFSIFILIFSFFFLITKKDVFGFSLTLMVFFVLRKYPRERLFYFSMYIVVLFLELIGTFYECWWWPTTWFGKIDFITSANPPAGISFFYFGLDRGTMSIYKRRHRLVWSRFKRIQQLS